jgi:hypothetical protein
MKSFHSVSVTPVPPIASKRTSFPLAYLSRIPTWSEKKIHQKKELTIVTCLDQLVEFATKIIALEEDQVPAIGLIGQAVERDPLNSPEFRDTRHPPRELRELLTHTHLYVCLNLFDPGIQGINVVSLEGKSFAWALNIDGELEGSLVDWNFAAEEVKV